MGKLNYLTSCQDGKILTVSDEWLEIFGYERDNVIGRHPVELGLVSDLQKFTEFNKKLRERSHIADFRTQLHTAAGAKLKCKLYGYNSLSPRNGMREHTVYVDVVQHGKISTSRNIEDPHWKEEGSVRIMEWLVDVEQKIVSSHSNRPDMIGTPELAPIDYWNSFIEWGDQDCLEEVLRAHSGGLKGVERRHVRLSQLHARKTALVATVVKPVLNAPLFLVTFYLHQLHTDSSNDGSSLSSVISRRMQEVGQVGGWELNIATGELSWTAETRRIHGVHDDYCPKVEEALAFYAPEAKNTIATAVQRGMDTGEAWDLELPIIRADGSFAWVRAAGETEMVDGVVTRLFGAFQDVTQRVQQELELREARCWMELACDSGGVGLWSVDAVDGSVTWNDKMAEHFQGDDHAVPNSLVEWLKLMPASQAGLLKAQIKALKSGGDKFQLEINRGGEGGVVKTLKLSGQAYRDAHGFTVRILGSCIDLSAEKLALDKFAQQSQHMAVTLASIGDGVITTDEQQRITWLNPAAEEMLRCDRGMIIGSRFCDVLELRASSKHDEKGHCVLALAIEGNTAFTTEECTLAVIGHQRALEVTPSVAPIVDGSGATLGAVLVFKDMSEQKLLSAQIEYRATHDALTDILNRSELAFRYQEFVGEYAGVGLSYLFYIDIDYFKKVNDGFGHSTGDALLQKVARCVKQHFCEASLVGRYGGDEFVVVSRFNSVGAARESAQFLCAKIASMSVRASCGLRTTRIGASIGIAEISDPAANMEVYLRRADIAAYAAKHSGRGQARLWCPESSAMLAAEHNSSISQLLEEALEGDGFRVFGQRIFAASPVGCKAMTELLIRLEGKDGTMLSPASFFGAAERYGLLPRIDLWMLGKCIEIIDRTSESEMYTINISGHSMESRPFKDAVIERLSGCSIEVRQRICLEVTEDTMISNLEEASEFLAIVRRLGAKVAIDDFGAGASSFRYLKAMPADLLKIDGSFVRSMDDPVSLAALKCFIDMARLTGLVTVAEHVESDEECKALAELGIDLLQGFALARPEPVIHSFAAPIANDNLSGIAAIEAMH
ncbi:EAL domain-containing protein [Paracoccus sp. 1_MG-2023]|uniref:EAL domain-containing protein n=1 Tax=unclassified Paracoccus (in: a-proteobacteria) TaxID=2688777 RepID=UPI001C0891E8|nr:MULTISPECIES: EAL domain-containing protein [unclassified Paracoccus (in: a-proteobacteria)]MBU2956808.1 EAL domain-containing protein [Paracoccus sp. C2R09]MDO6670461.1 EAL domain-containing protein [Paracoccus sp. 1_MG-2023]